MDGIFESGSKWNERFLPDASCEPERLATPLDEPSFFLGNDGKTLLPRNLPTLGFFQQRKHGKPMVAMAMTRFELVTF